MKYILDTNVVSMFLAGEPTVTERLFSMARTDVLIPQPAVAEIEYGIARLPASARRRRLRGLFERVLADIATAPWTTETSRAFGVIKATLETRGQRIEDFDIAIASHAMALDAVLVTDNVSHLGRVRGLRIENWRDRGRN